MAAHLTHKAGFTTTTAKPGAVTLIRRFGRALNLNIHFYMLFLDGVYIESAHGHKVRFRRVKAPKEAPDQTPAEKHRSMTWAMRLKRVFDIPQGTLS